MHVENLTKIYGENVALDAASFLVKKGQITGFLGPNGAGKTTMMNIMCGYISASAGRVLIDGKDLRDDPERAKRMIGYLPERPPLYGEMLVHEYLDFVITLKGVPKGRRRDERERICRALGLADKQNRLIGNLSQGYRQRIGLAQALCGSPEILVLDEPTVGLDPRQIIEFRNFIVSLKPECTILVSSHILAEIESFCDHFVVINQGKIISEGTKLQLMNTFQEHGEQILVRVRGHIDNVFPILGGISQVRKLDIRFCDEDRACEFLIYSDLGCDLRESVFYALAENSLPLLSMMRTTMSLEDVFLRLTQK